MAAHKTKCIAKGQLIKSFYRFKVVRNFVQKLIKRRKRVVHCAQAVGVASYFLYVNLKVSFALVVALLPFPFVAIVVAAPVVRLVLWGSTRRMVNQRLLFLLLWLFLHACKWPRYKSRIVKLFGLDKQPCASVCVFVCVRACVNAITRH